MKSLFTRILIPLLVTAMVMATAFPAKGQEMKPARSGYAPANGSKVYYEVYGEGRPVVLLHGAFYTIRLNWGGINT